MVVSHQIGASEFVESQFHPHRRKFQSEQMDILDLRGYGLLIFCFAGPRAYFIRQARFAFYSIGSSSADRPENGRGDAQVPAVENT